MGFIRGGGGFDDDYVTTYRKPVSPSRLELSSAAYSIETHLIWVQQVCCQTVKHTSHVQSAWHGIRIVDKHVVSGQAIVGKSKRFAVVRGAKLHKCEGLERHFGPRLWLLRSM